MYVSTVLLLKSQFHEIAVESTVSDASQLFMDHRVRVYSPRRKLKTVHLAAAALLPR